jgi:DNA-binding LytR/AlgR family response regulator
MLRVLVCDDEPLAVRRLVSILGEMPDVLVVATAETGIEAVEKAGETGPDLMLLDIEMPGSDGFDVVELLASATGGGPLVAFVTAHRVFAPDAFDTGVVDFLQKPVRRPRLEKAIARARAALLARDADHRLRDLQQRLDEMRHDLGGRRDEHIWVARRGGLVRVELRRIDRVAAEGAYVRIHVGADSYLHRESMSGLEALLDPDRFVRVHRSHVVRDGFVASIRRTIHGGGELLLSCGTVVPLGRKYALRARRHLLAKCGD